MMKKCIAGRKGYATLREGKGKEKCRVTAGDDLVVFLYPQANCLDFFDGEFLLSYLFRDLFSFVAYLMSLKKMIYDDSCDVYLLLFSPLLILTFEVY